MTAAVPKPPYPKTIKVPITISQRNTIIQYLQNLTGVTVNPKITDSDLVNLYINIAYEGGTPVVSGGVLQSIANDVTGTVEGPLSAITTPFQLAERIFADLASGEFWVRVGEFLGGFILVAIGAHALVSDSLHPNSKHTLGSSTRSLAKGVAKVAK